MLSSWAPQKWFMVLTAVAILCGSAQAADNRPSVIQVDNMHCSNCASKIARKLYAVPGVTHVACDVKAGTATVRGQNGKNLSPKALWEAVEKATFKVVKLTAPSGTHTKKPAS